jgi:hypothetical protein
MFAGPRADRLRPCSGQFATQFTRGSEGGTRFFSGRVLFQQRSAAQAETKVFFQGYALE